MADATMDDVVRRLTIHSAHYPDLRVLLAAYQLVREERDDLREFADKVREIDPIMARMIANGIGPRTGGTE
jgi:cytidylate kinase